MMCIVNLVKMLQDQICKWIQGEKWYMKKGSLEHEQSNTFPLGHDEPLNCQREGRELEQGGTTLSLI